MITGLKLVDYGKSIIVSQGLTLFPKRRLFYVVPIVIRIHCTFYMSGKAKGTFYSGLFSTKEHVQSRAT